MGNQSRHISGELHAAQQRLLQLRAQLQLSPSGHQAPPAKTERTAERPLPTKTITQLPAHLGWESAAVTQTLRQTQKERQSHCLPLQQETAAASPTPSSPSLPKTVKVYPDIAIGLLRREQVAAGRLWLLLQALDANGRGWIEEQVARCWFASKRAPLRFCGVRQLRNLLARGEALFWQRENGRIWLRSVAKVAFSLQVPKLQMRPVAIPLRVLQQKIGTVRAHLYATFHSSRSHATHGEKPIARETVARLTRVQPRTQRRYERKAKVKRQVHYAIGGQATAVNLQARGWQQGQATFQFKDFKGKQGPQGKDYVAWQLPNSYTGPHSPEPKGRQKRINRALTDLFMKGMTGNGQRIQIEARRFFDNGRLAAKAYLRSPNRDHYWRGVDNGRYQLWQVMEGNALSAKLK